MSGSTQQPRTPQRQGSNWELDADELDRYMSGQPSREPRFDPYGRSQTDGRTERQPVQQPRTQQPLRRNQPLQPAYDDYAPEPEQEWVEDDYGYEAEPEFDDYAPEPAPAQPTRQRRPAPRQRQPEPEYDDDLYEDPYVLDDDEVEPRPQRRRAPRPNRDRPARPSASFTLPPAIAETPIVKDRTALMMAGIGILSVLMMVIIVATRRDMLPEIIFTHVNANGEPANLQTASAIWNLPLIAGMTTLISLIAAWFLARWGEFLPRFLLGGALGVQFVAWVAVIAYLF